MGEEASMELIRSLELGRIDAAAAAFGRASLEYVGESGWTALHWAVHSAATAQSSEDDCGQIGMAQCCCPAKATPEMRQLVRAILATSKAARSINVRTDVGATPLMFAADAGDADLCQWVLKAGADRTLVDDDGDSAAAWAKLKEHTALMEQLAC